ncbi:hypothetical protein [Fructilactobacillus sanfranciscensis]|uniref:hypothetical protein n=2 Tax=Fructilactobacillus sanfranciscensis TaxID=1625 RepID=UPI00384A4A78
MPILATINLKKLVVEFKPASNAGSADSQVKPLEKLLTKQLHIPVKVVMQTGGNSLESIQKKRKISTNS